MKTRRTPLALAIAVVSLGLVAACSDEADQPQSTNAPAEQVTPTPGATSPSPNTPPAEATPPVSSPSAAPATNPTMPPPQDPTSPSGGSDGVTGGSNSPGMTGTPGS